MSTEKKHGNFGDKIRGAAHVVHGIGEDVRGSVMGAFESVSGTEETQAKDQDIASKGRSEIEQGIAQMKGHPAEPAATATAPEPQPQADTVKVGEQQQTQPAKDEGPGPTPVPPPSPVQSRQESVGQFVTESMQQGSQETWNGSETQFPQSGKDEGYVPPGV